jgi:hypothetical protein
LLKQLSLLRDDRLEHSLEVWLRRARVCTRSMADDWGGL